LPTYQTLERELADQKLSGLLVATDLTKSDGTGLVAVRLLDTSGGGGALAGGLGGELLAGSLATSGLAGGCRGKVSKKVLTTKDVAKYECLLCLVRAIAVVCDGVDGFVCW
jgi:hypothetical protein